MQVDFAVSVVVVQALSVISAFQSACQVVAALKPPLLVPPVVATMHVDFAGSVVVVHALAVVDGLHPGSVLVPLLVSTPVAPVHVDLAGSVVVVNALAVVMRLHGPDGVDVFRAE